LCDSDLELVRRARNGDERACHQLVDRHADPMFRLAYVLAGNAADAEDIVQETFSAAFRALAAFRERSSVRTWLNGILVRRAARLRRFRRTHKTVSLDAGGNAVYAVGGTTRSKSSAESVEVRLDVNAALGILSSEHRQVVVLREFQGMTYREIAEVLRIPQGTVESRLHRARRELRSHLRGHLG